MSVIRPVDRPAGARALWLLLVAVGMVFFVAHVGLGAVVELFGKLDRTELAAVAAGPESGRRVSA